MYKALIDSQSLKDPKLIEKFQVVGNYEEHWPGEEVPVLLMSKVSVADEEIDSIIEHLKGEWLEEGWFVLLWNDSHVFVVFAGASFTLTNSSPWVEEELRGVIAYGAAHEVAEKYFMNMRKVMDAWK